MPYQNPKGEPVKAGDEQITTGFLNKLREGMPRQIRGAGDVDVEHMGDRLLIRQKSKQPRLPDSGNYYAPFVIRQEFDDYLLCTPFQQPVGPTNEWVPQGYDKNLGANALVFVYIAKPYVLQKAPWDGKSVDLNGSPVLITFDPLVTGRRTLTDALSATITQNITSSYVTGEIITAKRCVTGLVDPSGTAVGWQDENDAARQWAASTTAGASTTKYETYWRSSNTNIFSSAGGERVSGPAVVTLFPANAIFALPFLVPRATRIAYIVAYFQQTTGTHVRFGVYSNIDYNPGTQSPGVLLAETASIDVNGLSGSIGNYQEFPFVSGSITVSNDLVWLVMMTDGTGPTMPGRSVYDLWPMGAPVPDKPLVGWFVDSTTYGAFASDFTSYGTLHVNQVRPTTGYSGVTSGPGDMDIVPWYGCIPEHLT